MIVINDKFLIIYSIKLIDTKLNASGLCWYYVFLSNDFELIHLILFKYIQKENISNYNRVCWRDPFA